MMRTALLMLDALVNQRLLLATSHLRTVFSSLVCFSAICVGLPAHAEEETGQTQATNIGPTAPIGHSLQTPEAKKRIESLISEQNNAKNSSIKENTDVSPSLPPLVGGQYGFASPQNIVGVPKAFVNLGDKFPSYAIVVEKLHHRLTLFKVTENKKYEAIKTYRAITGKDPNDKKSRGDLRTPEGIYFVTSYIDGKNLPAKYGRMAFVLDYPNIYDQRDRKSGYGIWIHATDDPKRLLKPFDTEGCVALSNEDIAELKGYITSFETPVVITKEMTTANYEEVASPREPAMQMIEAWRKSWEGSDFEQYMGYYSKNFRSLSKNKNQWQNYKESLSKMREGDISVTITEPKILAFEDQLLVTFFQDYKSPQHADFGRKFLYLQWEGDRYRIIAEKWYSAKRQSTLTNQTLQTLNSH